MRKEHIWVLYSVAISSGITFITLGLVWYVCYQQGWMMHASVTSAPHDDVTRIHTETTIPDVVERSIPAVVSIGVSADIPIIEEYYEDFWNPFGGLFGEGFGFQIPRQRQIGTERQEIGGGTGFFVSEDGYIVTNKHVVDREGVEYSIVTHDGTTYDVQIIAKDPVFDVAVLKVEDHTRFTPLTFADTDDVRLGESVIAIGNALAEFPNSVSVGVISGLSRNIVAGDGFRFRESLEGVIQTDAAINRGNSGGPLLNMEGTVVGMNVAVAGGGENIGFALPGHVVRSVFESVLEHGEIIRPFLGVRYMHITEEIANKNGLKYTYGVLVVRGEDATELAVTPGSPADKAGIVENDIILEVDGKKLDESQSLQGVLSTYTVGDTVSLTVVHRGEEKQLEVKLDRQP